MTRQPSTRTAEPRTAAGRELVSSPMPLHPDPDIAREVLRDAVDAIEAEAWDKGVDAGAQAYADDHPEAAAPAASGAADCQGTHHYGLCQSCGTYMAAAPAGLDEFDQTTMLRAWTILTSPAYEHPWEPDRYNAAAFVKALLAEYARLRQGTDP